MLSSYRPFHIPARHFPSLAIKYNHQVPSISRPSSGSGVKRDGCLTSSSNLFAHKPYTDKVDLPAARGSSHCDLCQLSQQTSYSYPSVFPDNHITPLHGSTHTEPLPTTSVLAQTRSHLDARYSGTYYQSVEVNAEAVGAPPENAIQRNKAEGKKAEAAQLEVLSIPEWSSYDQSTYSLKLAQWQSGSQNHITFTHDAVNPSVPRTDSFIAEAEPEAVTTPLKQPVEPTKPKRKRASPAQVEVLNRSYERTAFPSAEERQALAMKLDMPPRSVQIWYEL